MTNDVRPESPNTRMVIGRRIFKVGDRVHARGELCTVVYLERRGIVLEAPTAFSQRFQYGQVISIKGVDLTVQSVNHCYLAVRYDT